LFLWSKLSSPRSLSKIRIVGQEYSKFNFLDWSILLFLTIIFVTSLIGVNPSNSFWGNQARANGVFIWLHFGVFYFLMVSFFRSYNVIASLDTKVKAKPSSSFFLTAVIVAVLVSITALFPNILPESWQASSGGGIIGNRAFLASYLILAAGISLYLFVKYENKCRWLFLAALILFIYTIFDTGNRGALVGIIAGILLGLALCLFFVHNKKIKIGSAISLFVLCSLFFVLFIFKDKPVLQKFVPSISGLTSISFSSGTVQTRLLAWQSAWQGIKERSFQGWGWGNYGVVFDKNYNPQFLKYGFSETVWDKPHNWLLEVGVTSGMGGVIVYLAILFFAGFYLLKNKNFILFATTVAHFIANLFLFETTNSLILWFLFLAFVSASDEFSCHPRVSGDSVVNERIGLPDSSLRKNNKARRGFILFAILIIFYLLFFNFRSFKSSYFMRQAELSSTLMEWTGFVDKALSFKVPFLSENAVFLAEQFTKFDKAGAIANSQELEKTVLKIAAVLEKGVQNYPDDLSFPIWAGQVYLVLGEKFNERYYYQAEENLLKAEKISPNKQEVLFLLGRLYLLKKDFGKALDFQNKAVAAAPEINISHWFLGLTYVAQGERAAGLKEIEKAIELGYSLTVDQKLYVLDIYALEKNYSKLIDEYKKMIESDPENVNWLIKLAAIYAESGDKKAALETTRQAVGLFPPLKIEAEKFIKQYKLLENK